MDYVECVKILKDCRETIQKAHDEAELKHDNYGEFYMDNTQWEIILTTGKLLERIDKLL